MKTKNVKLIKKFRTKKQLIFKEYSYRLNHKFYTNIVWEICVSVMSYEYNHYVNPIISSKYTNIIIKYNEAFWSRNIII